jgi:hypothetical protein
MLRYLPQRLISHPALPAPVRTYLADIPEKELSKYEVEAVGQLCEMLIRDQVPAWPNYFKAPADGLCAGRALTTNLLREEYFFTADEIAAGRAAAETAGPLLLLRLYFRTATLRRERTLARLQALAASTSTLTNTPVRFASELAA